MKLAHPCLVTTMAPSVTVTLAVKVPLVLYVVLTGAAEVSVVPLPRSHDQVSGGAGLMSGSSTTLAENVTDSGATPLDGVAVNVIAGSALATTTLAFATEIWPASSLTANDTTKPPTGLSSVYALVGFASVDVVPSPKSHAYATTLPPYGASSGSPEPADEKAIFCPRLTLVPDTGAAITATGTLSATVMGTVELDVRPDGVLTVNVAVKVPVAV